MFKIKKFFSILVYLLLGAFITFATTIGGFLYYIKNQERPIPFLPSIIKKWQYLDEKVLVNIKQNSIRLDTKNKQVVIEIKGMVINSQEQQRLSIIPEINVVIDLPSLFYGNGMIRKVIVNSPELFIYHNIVDHSKKEKIGRDFEEINHLKFLSKIAGSFLRMFGVDIRIYNAKIHFLYKTQELIWEISKLESHRNGRHYNIALDASLGNKTSFFTIDSEMGPKDDLLIDVKFKQFPILVINKQINNKLLNNLLVDDNGYLVADGNINTVIDIKSGIKSADFKINAANNHYATLERKNNTPPIILSVSCDAKLKNREINISDLKVNFAGGTKLTTSAKINISEFYDSEKIEIRSDIYKFFVGDLKYFWPKNIATEAREWLTTKMLVGVVDEGSFYLKMDEKDLQNLTLSPGQLKANLKFSDVRINDIAYLPPITQLKGTASFDAKKVSIDISNGIMEKIKLSKGQVDIDYCSQDPKQTNYVKIQGETKGKIAEYRFFIPEDVVNLQKYKLDLVNGKGDVEAKFNTQVPIIDEISVQDIPYKIDLNLINVSLIKNLPEYLINSKKTYLESDGQKLSVNSKGFLSNIDLIIDFVSYYDDLKQKDDKFSLKLLFNSNNIKSFIGDSKNFQLHKGILPIELSYKNNKFSVTANLTKTQLKFNRINYSKDTNEKAIFSANMEFDGDEIILDNMLLKGDNIDINSSYAVLDPKLNIQEFYGGNIKAQRNDFSIYFNNRYASKSLELSGNSLDLSNYDFSQFFENNEQNLQNFKISAKLNKMIMHHGVEFNKTKLNLNCKNGSVCEEIAFTSSTDKNESITVKQSKIDNIKQNISITSNSASALLNSIGVYKNIIGGKLELNIIREVMNQAKNDIKYYGNLEIKDFVSTKNSVLTLIVLNLISPEGLANLSGKGNIKMKDFNTDLEFYKGKIKISEGIANGSSVRVIVNGNIDTDSKQVDIRGQFIPSVLGINRFISSVPILGRLFLGKNGAIIAATFRVSGEYNDPKVNINPLSLLTPGFLRKIFE